MTSTSRDLTNFFDFITEILGSTKNIKINTNVYKHAECDYKLEGLPPLNLAEDIYTFECSKASPLDMDAIKAFLKHFTEQTEEINVNRWYHFEGIKFNSKSRMYEIRWGS